MAAVSVKRSILFRCHCPSSGSLILSGQIVHINEAKANWPFTTKDNVLLTPRPSYSSTVNLFSLSNFNLYFYFPSYIDPTSIHIDKNNKTKIRLSYDEKNYENLGGSDLVGLQPGWITFSSICIILHIIRKPI